MANLRRWIVSLCTRRKAGASSEEWKNIRLSFSQFGEDLLLQHLLPDKGFYIDLGANHPVTHSNTWLFYRNGWRGITVEPNPALAVLHRKRRPRDIMIEAAAGEKEGDGFLHVPASHLLGFVSLLRSEPETFRPGVRVPVLSLRGILERHLPSGTPIDLLNVDCEGMDLQILKGNAWEKFRPTVICAESKTRKEREDLEAFLREKRYLFMARAKHSVIYLEEGEFRKKFPEL